MPARVSTAWLFLLGLATGAWAADDATIVSANLPSRMSCGASYAASVTVKNTGTTAWTKDVYKFGAPGGNDPLGGPARVYLSSNVAPGGQYTFEFTLKAPASGTTVTTKWQMVHESVAWFGTQASSSVAVSCAAPVDGATIMSANLPTQMACGATFAASVTVKNSGTTTWTKDVYKLGAPGGNDPLGGPARVYLSSNVAPGGQYTFNFTLKAPASGTTVTTTWQMVREGVAWFGGQASRSVTVSCPVLADGATIVSANLPTQMVCGATYAASVTVKNTGTTTWTKDVYKLGAPGGNDPLGGPARVYLSSDVALGGQYTFNFTLKAPASGTTVTTTWQMVHEGVEWFGGQAARSVTVNCPVLEDGATIVSANLPTQMACGTTFAARVTVKNTGTTTWTKDIYKLGAPGSNDPLGGPARVYLPNDVAPGGQHTFEFTLTAPGSSATVTTTWQMVHEGVAWFGGAASSSVQGGCVDDATIVSMHLPTQMACGTTFAAWVTVKNTGTTRWTKDVYKLGAPGANDPLGGPARVYLPNDLDPGGQHTFEFTLTAPASSATVTTQWQMVHEGVAWFGGAAASSVQAGCVDGARIVSADLPTSLACGATYPASVTVENTGTTPWTRDTHRFGSVGDSDGLGGPGRVLLPPGETVDHGEQHTFNFTLTAPATAGTVVSDWQMVHEGVAWFGPIAGGPVDVACGGAQADFSCDVLVQDAYGQPLAGKTVTIRAWGAVDEAGVIGTDLRTTDSQGRARPKLSLASDVYAVECAVDPSTLGSGLLSDYRVTIRSGVPMPKPFQPIALSVTAIPLPTANVSVYGLKETDGAHGALYQSGPYDKVAVVPEMFNSDEQTQGMREREGLWRETKDMMTQLYSQGYDVWLVDTLTGKNIHEQAAELAQVIQYAASGYPNTPGGAGFNGNVAVLGISLGGVVAAEATARWQSDADWRSQLRLQATLPVGLLYLEDAPLRGAQVNYDLQDFIHEPVPLVHLDGKGNFNSCAFQQLVRASKLSELAGRGEGGNFSAFFDEGTEVRFRSQGVCDSRSGDDCVCAAGPAISKINGDGFPHASGLRAVAHSCGSRDEPNTCYGNEWDRDRKQFNVCPDAVPWVPQVGDVSVTIKFPDPFPGIPPDIERELIFRAEDLVPGSRQGGDLGTAVGKYDWLVSIKQHAPGTFMPTWTAFGVEGDAYACAVDDCYASEHNATHISGRPETIALLLQELKKTIGSAPPSGARLETRTERLVGGPNASGSALPVTTQAQAGTAPNLAPIVTTGGPYTIGVAQPLELDATASDPDGVVTRTFWNFGDGTFGEGTHATHTYAEPGTYTVFFSATDIRGAGTAAHTTVTVARPGLAKDTPDEGE